MPNAETHSSRSESSGGYEALAVLVPAVGWTLAKEVKAVLEGWAFSQPGQIGISFAVGIVLLILFWRLNRVAAFATFLASVLASAKLSDGGLSIALVVVVLLVVALLARESGQRKETKEDFMARVVAPFLFTAVAALVGAAVWVHGSRYGFLPGTRTMDAYLWNPQVTLPLWAAFGTVLGSIDRRHLVRGLAAASAAAAVVTLTAGRGSAEALLAYCATASAVAIQIACRKYTPLSFVPLVVVYALSLGVCSAVTGPALGLLTGSSGEFLDHGAAGVFAGTAVGLYRAFAEGGAK